MGKHRAPDEYHGRHRAEDKPSNHPHILPPGDSPAKAAQRLADHDQSPGKGRHAAR